MRLGQLLLDELAGRGLGRDGGPEHVDPHAALGIRIGGKPRRPDGGGQRVAGDVEGVQAPKLLAVEHLGTVGIGPIAASASAERLGVFGPLGIELLERLAGRICLGGGGRLAVDGDRPAALAMVLGNGADGGKVPVHGRQRHLVSLAREEMRIVSLLQSVEHVGQIGRHAFLLDGRRLRGRVLLHLRLLPRKAGLEGRLCHLHRRRRVGQPRCRAGGRKRGAAAFGGGSPQLRIRAVQKRAVLGIGKPAC